MHRKSFSIGKLQCSVLCNHCWTGNLRGYSCKARFKLKVSWNACFTHRKGLVTDTCCQAKGLTSNHVEPQARCIAKVTKSNFKSVMQPLLNTKSRGYSPKATLSQASWNTVFFYSIEKGKLATLVENRVKHNPVTQACIETSSSQTSENVDATIAWTQITWI